MQSVLSVEVIHGLLHTYIFSGAHLATHKSN